MHLLQAWNNVICKDYLDRVRKFVSLYNDERLHLANEYTMLMMGSMNYEQNELYKWGNLYLDDIVNMHVLGRIEDYYHDLTLMTCEDKKIYAFDGEELHLVAFSVRQLYYKGIKYPGFQNYYKGEPFRHMTETDWNKLRRRLGLDKKHKQLVKSKKPAMMANLAFIKQQMEKSQCTSTIQL